MASEETPLLDSQDDLATIQQHEAVYARFSPVRKRTIVALVALAGLSPRMYS